MPHTTDVSVVIPVLNDHPSLRALLVNLAECAPRSWEVVVADGGSSDDSAREAEVAGARLVVAEANRGLQLDAGLQASSGRLVWFLHADNTINVAAIRALEDVTRDMVNQAMPVWGRFDVQLGDRRGWLGFGLGVVGRLMSWRSRWTGICTGDQGIFASRQLLDEIGGVPRQPLMEDIELSKRLKATRRPLTFRTRIGASGRRWESNGFFRTVLAMWELRLRYFLGASPEDLARRYYA